ncbi:MAG: type I-E CRISPR-associated protein Cas6/Cse3/CasE [Chloroflexi bacterium]|nr:type I-E CRISPR-associated protein Cas6/Cse3/CasE [Chloroflexota bacterium]
MYLSRLTLNARDRTARAWLADCHELHRTIMSGFGQAQTPEARAELGVLFRVEETGGGAGVTVLVQSREQPRWAIESPAVLRVDGPKEMTALEEQLVVGASFRFRLRANPTRRVHHRATLGPDTRELDTRGNWREPGEIPDHERTGIVRRPEAEGVTWWKEREDGKRIGKRVEIRREEERLAWLARRGAGFDGFELKAARLVQGEVAPVSDDDQRFWRSRADPAGTIIGGDRDRRVTFGTALFEGQLVVTDAAKFRDAWATGIGPGKAFGCGLLSLAREP